MYNLFEVHYMYRQYLYSRTLHVCACYSLDPLHSDLTSLFIIDIQAYKITSGPLAFKISL